MMSLESYTTAHESATSSAYFDDSLSRRARYGEIVLINGDYFLITLKLYFKEGHRRHSQTGDGAYGTCQPPALLPLRAGHGTYKV